MPTHPMAIVSVLAASLGLLTAAPARADGEPGRVESRGWIGVQPALAETYVRRFLASSERGIMVRRVSERSPAAEAGLRARDTILAWDGRDVHSWHELARWIRSTAPGTGAVVRVARRDWSARHGWSEHALVVIVGESTSR